MSNKIKLYTIPYAGGSAAIYNSWKELLSPEIELVPLELAGRGRRIYEKSYQTLDEAYDDACRMIENDLDGSPYAIFGHSLGSMIGYGAARKLTERGRTPEHLFFSGRSAPHLLSYDESDIIHNLPDEKFIEKIEQLGGTPPGFFEQKELLELLLPVIRADFKIAESYKPITSWKPFPCDISIYQGKEDKMDHSQVTAWADQTEGICNIRYYNGAHFFIHNETEEITGDIKARLCRAGRERV